MYSSLNNLNDCNPSEGNMETQIELPVFQSLVHNEGSDRRKHSQSGIGVYMCVDVGGCGSESINIGHSLSDKNQKK